MAPYNLAGLNLVSPGCLLSNEVLCEGSLGFPFSSPPTKMQSREM